MHTHTYTHTHTPLASVAVRDLNKVGERDGLAGAELQDARQLNVALSTVLHSCSVRKPHCEGDMRLHRWQGDLQVHRPRGRVDM